MRAPGPGAAPFPRGIRRPRHGRPRSVFFFQAEDGIRDWSVTGVQTCALPILGPGGETAAYWLERCYALEAERAAARIRALGNEAAFHRVRGDFLVRVKGDAQSATEDYEKAKIGRASCRERV